MGASVSLSQSMSSMARNSWGTGRRGQEGGVGVRVLPGGRMAGLLSLSKLIAGRSERGVGTMYCQGSGLKSALYSSLFLAGLTLSSKSSLP